MQLDSALASAGNAAIGIGAGTAIGGWLTAEALSAMVGALAAVVGVVIAWYYKRKADKRDQELHQAQLQDLREQHGTPEA